MVLDKGDYFGEKALYNDGDTRRRANAIALPPGTECYTIDREYAALINLKQLIGNYKTRILYCIF